MEFKGSRTEANLLAAFAGESQARNKYTYYESAARKEGYQQIANIFKETADNEKEHAKLWFKYAHGIGSTLDNLKDAAAGEHFEWTDMYKEFEETARAEGFNDIAAQFALVGKIEKHHEERYNAMAANIENGGVFKKTAKVQWICLNCGHIHSAEAAPDTCPACKHPQSYFAVLCENF